MIHSEAQLRQLYAAPADRALRKQLPALDGHCQRFIQLSPFCVLASGGAEASTCMDASPRGGTPGFVRVVDAQTLWIPDASGNNRLDTLCNLLHDPRIGLLFMIPGVLETLRVNGRARLREETVFTEAFATATSRPKLVIEVQVQEAYLHCAKSLMRSKLWELEQQVKRDVLPSMNTMIHEQIGAGPPTESQQDMVQRFAQQLAREQGR